MLQRSIRRIAAPLALLAASTVVAVLLAEAVLRVAIDPADFLHATLIEDPILGQRIQPLTTGHDALGYRNRAVPENADIVAIGDSMTYGVSAPRDGSWPKQLGAMLGEEVYNMGLGGFGPLQYLHLAQHVAPQLKPRLLIVGFFFGNDMMDAYYVARSRPHWHGWRVAAEAAAESTAFDRAGQAEPRKRFAALRNWLSRNSVFYSVLRDTLLRRFAMAEQDTLAQGTAPDVRLLWRDASPSQVRTIFTPRYRLAAVDMRNREVREGMQISQNALAALKASADRGAIRLLVVLIPTKERAYCRQLRSSGFNLPESYQQLCEAEAQASAALRHFLVEHDIGYVDVLPALEAHISRNLQLYPQDSDNHPQAAGYAVIARELEAAVRRLRSKN